MSEQFLYEKLDNAKEVGLNIEFPEIIEKGLSNKIILREYQIEAFKNFILYFESGNLRKNKNFLYPLVYK